MPMPALILVLCFRDAAKPRGADERRAAPPSQANRDRDRFPNRQQPPGRKKDAAVREVWQKTREKCGPCRKMRLEDGHVGN